MAINYKKVIIVFLITSCLVPEGWAQRRRKDSLSVYKEFIQIGTWYQRLPLQLDIKFRARTIPATAVFDSTETDISMFYGQREFYMLAEGMEQIVNDSMVVMVNTQAKIIKLYANHGQWQNNLHRTTMMFSPDSSFDNLVRTYGAQSRQISDGVMQITLQTKEKISETTIPKERITVTYHKDTHQPIAFNQSRFALSQIDSLSYQLLTATPGLEDRLMVIEKKGRAYFFLVKEQQVFCDFVKVNHQQSDPPVRQQDRVVKLNNGAFAPTKEYQDYFLSKEF